MTHMSDADLRQNLSRTLDEVTAARVPVFITRRGGKASVVLLAESEFSAWQETVHLLSSPANASRLRNGVREADAGLTESHDLIPPKV